MKTNSTYLISIGMIWLICSIFFLVLYTTLQINKGARFTYQDGVMLYIICEKNDFSDDIVNAFYGDTNTDFKKFLLSK